MKLWIGTSGFQYKEWKGKFYPAKLPERAMLPFYAEHFASTEINYSFRQIPSAKSIEGWAGGTPERFKFSFKAPQRVTHFAKLRGCMDTVEALAAAIRPLGEKLGAVLFQLPPTFKKDTPLLSEFLGSLPADLRATFEFRHESWFSDDVFSSLKEHRAALCLAENEDLATPAVATADFGYLRLRREDYAPADLKRWAKFVKEQKKKWRETFIYFKHEETGTGPEFAKQMLELLA
ncbi:MAG TPA: DUF72 domain-containing protein [Verrucomicrobiales bacterium]|nr:DUF72 domain-containing protein [Verrucomicrobiales bacterium]